ncbi:MAG: AAA family ATPase, partial [Endomicrobium sp.]|nr:AAA family ATPase [Endomicrobium sp.]
MKLLPIGTQSFEILRKSNCIYIDKTQYIYNLTDKGRIYFISRPRRFGKSLFINTIEELFKGSKDLFEGLYIYDKWDWEKTNPVIRIDFTEITYRSVGDLEFSLIEKLRSAAFKNSLELNNSSLVAQFAELIEKLHNKYGQKVVILVDEYDKPITDILSNREVLNANKTVLHDFYQVIKGADEHLQFVFLTGVSKFSGLSVFSALNNINDITVNEKYALICGYTQEDIENSFKEYIELAAQKIKLSVKGTIESVKYWYN